MGGRLALPCMLVNIGFQLSSRGAGGWRQAGSSQPGTEVARPQRLCVQLQSAGAEERSLLATRPTAGTPFWKLVLKQFDDLLVKVRQTAAGAAAGAAAETLLLAGQAPHAPHCPLLLHSATEAAACGLVGMAQLACGPGHLPLQ